jgi:DNA adenine methylase
VQKKNLLVKPYLKWAGGKRQLLSKIEKHLPKQLNKLRYYEPFIGAGAVFFDIQPKRAIINDYNSQLIMTYNAILRDIDGLIEALKIHRNNNSEEYFYEIRSQDRDAKKFEALTNTEKSARLIYLNKTCYNGLYRVNAQGLFNAPYGRYQNPAICDETVLRAIHHYLSDSANEIEILNGDFEIAVKTANHQSFVYFDPPYHSPDNTNFTGYQADKFDEAEQIRLRNTFSELTQRDVKCLLSNADTDFVRELYADNRYEIISVLAKRAINSDGAGRGNVREVLIKNLR